MCRSAMATLRHELLQDVADCAKVIAVGHGAAADLAEQVGHAIADTLAKSWGGQTISFPKDMAFDLSKRDLEIFNDWSKGVSVPALAKKYNLTIQWIYAIVKRGKQAMVNDRQGALDLG